MNNDFENLNNFNGEDILIKQSGDVNISPIILYDCEFGEEDGYIRFDDINDTWFKIKKDTIKNIEDALSGNEILHLKNGIDLIISNMAGC